MRIFRNLTNFERWLWLCSLLVVGASYLLVPTADLLSLIASLIGVTALLFVAKGYVIGQILTVVFAVFYGVISWHFHYYGEMITYLGMSAPMAVCAAVAWIENPYQNTAEVKVNRLTRPQVFWLFATAALVTGLFYFILKALGNSQLPVSTLSVTTSFLASALTFFRSPYYALAYAANDVILIVLWTLAVISNIAYLPMVICFVMFLVNDLYGYINWCRMEKRQE